MGGRNSVLIGAVILTTEMETAMKQWGYRLFASVYNVSRRLCKRKDKVVLFNGHNRGLNGNLQLVAEEIKRRDDRCEIVSYSKQDLLQPNGSFFSGIAGVLQFFFSVPLKMAVAKQIYLNDNFIPLAYMNTDGQQIIQLWHGAGAFKRFGLSTEENEEVRALVAKSNEKVTHLFVTSTQVISYYSEAFAIPPERIYATGVPVIDAYFDEEDKERRRQLIWARYPEWKGKKILLYTPTFRASKEENDELLERFDINRIQEILGEDWIILIKMHPKYPAENIPTNEYCVNMTDYSDITDLYMVADMLITDYSSTVVEFVLLNKPIILYAYDLEKYDRGFYRDYRETVPGEIAYTLEELLELLKKNGDDFRKRQMFINLQYDYVESGALERIFEVLA
ncbi:MAG: CDP-glycerol glycerophosphotransferase family protein [Lachnospiraceae bacterium]|nr:CDP-glycerol glycerophosphotransferase family protein [Lachnospiraceae bacterium]